MISDRPPVRLSADDFFARHYARLSGWLNRFSHAQHAVKHAAPASRSQAMAEVVSLGNQIVVESLAIVCGEPADVGRGNARDFFGAAGRLRDAMRQSGDAHQVAASEALGVHLDYFHRHVPDHQLDTSCDHEPQSIYVREAVLNGVAVLANQVLNTYQWSCPDPRLSRTFFDTATTEASLSPKARLILEDVKSLQGWCSPQKALLLYSLVREHKPAKVVEIGIYGGRSIVPIAAALKDNAAGEVWGIETWSGSAATAYRTGIANDFWWMNIDFTKIKGDFLDFVLRHDLHDTIRVIEAPSDRCGGLFDRIDMLHIDGNHSMYGAAQDVVNFVSKVPAGGIVVYDDINWPSTAAGLDILRDTCRLLHVVTAFGSDTEPGCAAFMKV